VEVFRTPHKGCGLRTLMDLPKYACPCHMCAPRRLCYSRAHVPRGTLVMEYCGEVLALDRFRRRTKHYAASGLRHFYFMTLDAETVWGCLFPPPPPASPFPNLP
jgi:hypothetical protein